MRVQVKKTSLDDVLLIVPEVFEDRRGFFLEVFREDEFRRAGLPTSFVQTNHSSSKKGVVRGLHFQWDPPMGKMMRVTRGTAFLVAVDIRHGSPNLGRWFGVTISAASRQQVWAPAGFARGLCALTDGAEVEYLCTGVYNRSGESGIRWDDPAIGIDWPLSAAVLSERDRKAQTLQEWLDSPESQHFRYRRNGESNNSAPRGAHASNAKPQP